MFSARGVSRASAILPSFHLKQFITFTNPVLIHKFLQCEILQRMLHRKTAFSGLTLPNSVDDYIGPDNPVRVVDAFVEQLDLQEAGFCRVEPEETGRPGYHPADLLKLYIYGYLNRVRSSRRIRSRE